MRLLSIHPGGELESKRERKSRNGQSEIGAEKGKKQKNSQVVPRMLLLYRFMQKNAQVSSSSLRKGHFELSLSQNLAIPFEELLQA